MKKFLYPGIVLSLLMLTILSGCGGGKSGGGNPGGDSGDPGGGTGSGTKYFAYVANRDSNTISAYAVGSDGTLSPAGSPVSASDAGGPRAVAADPAGKFLYVANEVLSNGSTVVKANVSVFKIGSDGALTPAGSPVYSSVEDSTFIALTVDPAGQFVYVADDGPLPRILSYRIDPSSGALSPVGTPREINDSPQSIAVDPTGKFVYVAANGNPSSSLVLAFTSSSGALSSLNSVLSRDIALYSNPGSIAANPTGGFIYAVRQSGAVSNLKIIAAGMLQPVGVDLTTSANSTAVTVDPTGQFVYVANGNGTISAFKIEVSSTLSPVGGSPFGSGLGALSSITVDPAVEFVYVTNQGSDSSPGTVSALKIDPVAGALSPVGTVNAGLGPASIVIVKKIVNN